MKTLAESNGWKLSRSIIERDWTQGSFFQNLVSLLWPITISSSFDIPGPVIDMVWVGKLGVACIAGIGIGKKNA